MESTHCSSDGAATTKDEKEVAMWKQKKLIETLDNCAGFHTSLITLLIPNNFTSTHQQMNRVSKLLSQEMATAQCIKSRVNRQSVLDALKSIQHQNESAPVVSASGGTTPAPSEKQRKMITMFEPIQAIPTFTYRCDSRFHTETLKEMLSDQAADKIAFIVVDGNGCLLATVQGNNQTVLGRITVDLMRKHHKGGQSSVRFARLRLEQRHNYMTKVSETATKLLIDQHTNKPICAGLILAGSADFKDELRKVLEPRLQAVVIGMVDVAYGFNQGLSQAISLSADILKDVSLIQQKKLLSKFFDEIAQDTGKVSFGVRDTMAALLGGAVDTLIVWEQLDLVKHEISAACMPETQVVYCRKFEDPLVIWKKTTKDVKIDGTVKLTGSVPVLDFLVDNYKKWGAKLELVQHTSDVGSQFCRGFGGLGALLRYRLDPQDDDGVQDDASEDDTSMDEQDARDYDNTNGQHEKEEQAWSDEDL